MEVIRTFFYLQIHCSQVESDYKEKLDNEVSAKKELEKVCGQLVSLVHPLFQRFKKFNHLEY